MSTSKQHRQKVFKKKKKVEEKRRILYKMSGLIDRGAKCNKNTVSMSCALPPSTQVVYGHSRKNLKYQKKV
ncbi:hypothetical protein, conserved [Trypanosoma brucei gambiense DAL972]|uniref:Uncharacterized protein n=1 Tax=Trypanosoma brucei gambiense (strain MHOM/CI/86/DAL972) TaxID=679716 RepID=C9ZJ91_TRYB9|nr:hypothetical protein, conserved [Trypanosoma brucei gambiense DAL972]CBH09450.1 hypothetical protein, conserved [Trypanosoma brucei gambiense DAL972]|eukprot:XP_011771755.1 hypothetical protein, conserved [Trypanosoma brucei gambiense DAL972]